jgi:hypothetical protein
VAFPGMDMNFYQPEWAGAKELNLGDQWRAMWVERDELPPNAPIVFGYVVVIADGKGYLTRRVGEDRWGIVESVVAVSEKPLDFVKRASLERVGASGGTTTLLGYFECKATSHNEQFPAGAATVRPIYLVAAKKLTELGRDSEFERRRLPLNEFVRALRDAYPEIREPILSAVDRYIVMQAKGAA